MPLQAKTVAKQKSTADLTSVATLATLPTPIVRQGQDLPGSQTAAVLAYLRRGFLDKKPADPLLIARTFLREATELYAAGEKKSLPEGDRRLSGRF
jgi:hypothetical protein